jgi:lipopolysaccharide/colanic/teichoic acid biosynthesis glycosyltransferase
MSYDMLLAKSQGVGGENANTVDMQGVESMEKEAADANGYLACKMVLEWTISLAMLIAASPLLLVLALVVKLTSEGPVFYRQTRVGLNGQLFRIYKIRSMQHDCEAKTGATWARPNDSRCTPIGSFMRATHLDELPQLINILRGEMSLIGPRPERPELVAQIEKVVSRYHHRLRVRPGLTGLAQVELPADSELDDVRHKLAYDLHYIENLSLSLDARVLICTALHTIGLALNAVGQLWLKSYRETVEENFQHSRVREEPRTREPVKAA